MKDVRFAITRQRFLPILLLAFCAFATRTASAQLKPGVVVEDVAKDYEGEKAGLHEGDIILSWSRGDARGEILSPFDLSLTEVEQAPRGQVTLEGLRGTEKRAWVIGFDAWNVATRPRLADDLLSSYLDGEKLLKGGKVIEAAQRWREAANHLDDSTPASARLWLLSQAGDAFAAGHQWKEADDTYQQAIRQMTEASPATQAELLRRRAKTYQKRGDWLNAEKCFQQSLLQDQQQGPESLIIAADLVHLGAVSIWQGNLRKAEEYYDQALKLREKLAPASVAVATSLSGLADVATLQGNPERVKQYDLQALDLRQRLTPKSPVIALIIDSLAIAEEEGGDLAKAQEYVLRALELHEEVAPDSNLVANDFNYLGRTASLREDFVKSEYWYHRELELRQKLGQQGLNVAMNLNNLGSVAERSGDLVQAEKYYRQALEINRKLLPGKSSVSFTIMIWKHLGRIARRRGALSRAEQYYRRALELSQKPAHETRIFTFTDDLASSLNNLGDVARDRGDLAKAEDYYRQALELRQKLSPGSPSVAISLENLGNLARDHGDLTKAEEYYRRALEIRERVAPWKADCAAALAALAGILRREGQLDQAAQLYERAVQVLEKQMSMFGGTEETRAQFRASHVEPYMQYVDLLTAQGKTDLAFEVVDLLHARSMLETLVAARGEIRKGVDVALIERERSLQQSINAKSNRRMKVLDEKHAGRQPAVLDKEISELLVQYNALEEQIRATNPEYAALMQPQPLSAKDVQQHLLDADTLLLEYSLGEEHSYLFAVTPDSVKTYKLPKRSQIERKARHVYELLTIRNNTINGERKLRYKARLANAEKDYSAAIAALSRIVLGPVTKQLQKKRLLIVSDGALQYVPFAVLSTPSISSLKRPIPLVAEHEIVNLPSASVLAELRRESANHKPAARTAAVLGDPVFAMKDERVKHASSNDPLVATASSEKAASAGPLSKSTAPAALFDRANDLDRSASEIGVSGDGIFPRLPFTRREADAIYSIAGKDDGLEALDFDASKATALSQQLKDYRIVHFATHALLNNEHPELSGLVFSLVDQQGQSQDGFLRMIDIYNMELNADLVVLSACQTALGKEIGEEGLIGLTRGFMYAGAPRVVASLWKVDDEATAALMKKFYEGMLREHETPAQALRAAQQWMRTQKAWQSPYYWAGFVLQGEWK